MSSVEENISFFESALLDFFKKAGREHLPWRREGISAYEVWVSEIMLQQTQVSRVLFYYEKFLLRFPNVEILARASWEEFLPYYAGLGYYARGRNMLRAAKMVVEKFDGKFPEDISLLETLPGIGKYTAAAIASFAYGANTIAWDTNVRRVIGRYFEGTKNFNPPADGQISRRETRKQNNQKTRQREFSLPAKILNAAMMDFGSAVCMGKPKCGACPLAVKCRYRREKGKRELGMNPPAGGEKLKNWKESKVVVTLHENHKKYFSSTKKSYQPFLLPPSHNTRAGIKGWFWEQYGLLVSVRPPHKREEIDGIPTIFVNAQILSGTHSFAEFESNE